MWTVNVRYNTEYNYDRWHHCASLELCSHSLRENAGALAEFEFSEHSLVSYVIWKFCRFGEFCRNFMQLFCVICCNNQGLCC